MSGLVPSKKLLLHGEIRDDNAAYNGEASGAPGSRGSYLMVQWITDSLEDQDDAMVIPWEVDQVWIQNENYKSKKRKTKEELYHLLGLTP